MTRARAVLATSVMVLLGGCVGARPVASTSAPAAMPAEAVAPTQRSIAYPHGQWILYGDGTPTSPYGWVWVPTGAAPPSRP